MKLLWKLAIPQILIVVCFGIVSFVVINTSFRSVREQYVRDVIENQFQFITNEIEASSQRAVSETSVFVRLPDVWQAYEMALAGDINDPHSPQSQAARDFLRRQLAHMLDSYNELMGRRLELHFHLPNSFSLVRLWREHNTRVDGQWVDMSDDLRPFRPTVLEANQTGEPALGIEVGSGGFAIRGVVPVFGPDGSQLGTAESLQQFDPILEAAAEDGKVFIALYANNEALDFSVELQDPERYPPIGDFVRVIDAKDGQAASLITAELLAKGKEGVFFESHGARALATLPLADYRGDQVGVIVCAMDTAPLTAHVNMASAVLALMLAGMAVVPTLALLQRLRKLVIRPLHVVEERIRDIAEDRADLTEPIPSRQNDEIGELAAWFNTLTTKLDGILAEREAMAHWYKSILDATPFPITVTDANMNWTFVNRAVEDFLGTTLDEMIGKPCSNWNAHICNTEDCGVACAKRGLKRTFFTQKGRSHQVDVEILKDLSGEIAGFIEVVQDITELEEMHKKQADAEAASQAKTNFLANMSHEIRTPLNAIIGMTSIAEGAQDVHRKDYAIRKIHDASTHLLGIVNDVLDMSKIEADKFELSHAGFDFEKMLQKAICVINFRVDERRQTFAVRIAKDIPQLLIGDDQRLAQVITNLLSNAVKFTPEEGSIRLDARLLSKENGKCRLQVSVADTGIGITEEQKTRLFLSFEQAEADTTRRFGGTGLGLAISKRIVELMDGAIWVKSEIGKGSRFSFTVVLGYDDGADPLPDGHCERVPENDDFAGHTILLVEDVDINREILLALLEPTRLAIECAENGKQAVRMYEAAPDKYKMIFMDIQMPEMDGYAATRAIRAHGSERAKTIPIIAMTANVFREDVERCLEAGMNGHIGKPLDVDEVFGNLRRYLL